MDFIKDKSKCCGCKACVNVCPRSQVETGKPAIFFEEDEEGFSYPYKNNHECISCDLCEKVCFYKNKVASFDDILNETKLAYAVQHINDNVRLNSQSGGLFVILSDSIISDGGIIYGAGLTDKFQVVHQRATTQAERDLMCGSKYVQSDMGEIYCEIKKDLEIGKKVMFSGTPCQVYGLRAFLRGWRENLYLVDIICHGTPSPKVWKDYICYMSNRYGKKIIDVNFRDKKEFGWNSHIETITFEKGKYANNEYTNLFYSELAQRPSCYNCPFANLNRPSDITIGDCWGIEHYDELNFDDKGTSLAIINTQKGADLFFSCKDSMKYKKILLKGEYLRLQGQLQGPIQVDRNKRNKFWQEYNRFGFEYIVKKYASREMKKAKSPVRFSEWKEKKNLVLWGTGNGFKDTIVEIQKYGTVKYICDNDSHKWGCDIALGIKCISPNELNNIDNKFVLLTVQNICTAFEIANQLMDMGITDFDNVYSWLRYADKKDYN